MKKPTKLISRGILGSLLIASVLIGFQNCSHNNSEQTMNSTDSNGANAVDETSPVGIKPSLLLFVDTSYAVIDANRVSESGILINQSIKGAGGAGLRGCTVPAAQANQLCLKDTDFRVIGGSGDVWKYNASSDTYSAYFDAPDWPLTKYLTRYILPNGVRAEVYFKPIVLRDASYGDGNSLIRIKQSLTGIGGANLKGCTVTEAQASQYCLKDSEFRVVGTAGDVWSYNSSTDTYSADFSANGWPQTNYVSRYILPDGRRLELRFTPGKSNSQLSAADQNCMALGGTVSGNRCDIPVWTLYRTMSAKGFPVSSVGPGGGSPASLNCVRIGGTVSADAICMIDKTLLMNNVSVLQLK